MIVRLAMGMAVALLVAAPASGNASAIAGACPPNPALARLVAQSGLILLATLAPDTGAVPRVSPVQTTVSLDLSAAIAIKGVVPEHPSVRILAADQPHAPSIASLTVHAGKPAVFFLVRVGEALYFAGETVDALRDASDLAAVRSELGRQSAILANWRLSRQLPHLDEAQALIGRLGSANDEAQAATFKAIEALGESAVPAIVTLMDDRRTLADPRISLANHAADAFESVRHYGPELVVDALAAILNQLSGQSFGDIANGGTEAARRAAVAGWRVYATDLACSKAR